MDAMSLLDEETTMGHHNRQSDTSIHSVSNPVTTTSITRQHRDAILLEYKEPHNFGSFTFESVNELPSKSSRGMVGDVF
jgi:hypothetical protein